MERKEAVIALEEDLEDVCWSARKASLLLQELVDDFFLYTNTAISASAFEHLRDRYERNCAKAEITRQLLDEIYRALDDLLDA